MELTRQVAIKLMRTEVDPYPDQITTQDTAKLFKREMQAVAKLDHPSILPLYDFGEEQVDGTVLIYMVMPYRSEGSFAAWLHKRSSAGPLSLEEAAHFVTQAAQALQHAHDHGLIHQDVKPANFLIRNRYDQPLPDIQLADFGIAKLAATTTTMSQSIRGTPMFMAPEQWKGQPTFATDQYALAIMAYLLLTKRYPFVGSMGHVMHQHLDIQPPPPSIYNSAIPPELDSVLLTALQKSPTNRFASLTSFVNAFQQALRANLTMIPSTQPVRASTPLVDSQKLPPTVMAKPSPLPMKNILGTDLPFEYRLRPSAKKQRRWLLPSLFISGVAIVVIFFAGVLPALNLQAANSTMDKFASALNQQHYEEASKYVASTANANYLEYYGSGSAHQTTSIGTQDAFVSFVHYTLSAFVAWSCETHGSGHEDPMLFSCVSDGPNGTGRRMEVQLSNTRSNLFSPEWKITYINA